MMMTMVCKSDSLQKTGFILSGLGLIFIGLSLMSDAMKVNRDAIQTIFETVTNPFLLFGIGIFLTALVQSSSATTSVIIAMSVAGLTIGTGGNEVLYIILGTNIGSCVTALMSSLTSGANAKRAGLIHLMFNTFGSVFFFILLMCWPDFMNATFRAWFESAATEIAMFHTFFNVTCTMLFLPFCNIFVKISELLIQEKKTETAVTYLDERMLSSASIAISQLEKEMVLLSDTAMDAFRTAYRSFEKKDKSLIEPSLEKINQAGGIYHAIVNYLIRLSAQSKLSDEENISTLHNNVGDIMRIAEIADNFTKYTQRTIRHDLHFSGTVKEEIGAMVLRVEEMYELTKRLILEKDLELLVRIDQTEQEIDAFRKKLLNRHMERLHSGECRPECSSVYINLVSNLERLGDHLTYIAHTVG